MDRNASADALLEALPYSKEAEQSVLGAVIADPARITDVLEYLKPESFYGSYNREIFSVLMRMFLASEKIDVVTLLDKVLSEGIFPTESDAKMYLVSLVEMVPSTSNVADYARPLRISKISCSARSMMLLASPVPSRMVSRILREVSARLRR